MFGSIPTNNTASLIHTDPGSFAQATLKDYVGCRTLGDLPKLNLIHLFSSVLNCCPIKILKLPQPLEQQQADYFYFPLLHAKECRRAT